MVKKSQEKFKTYEGVFDNFTYRNLYKLITQGYIEGLIGPLALGKEANVFTAETKVGIAVVKVYRLETCDFKQMYSYLKTDPRYISLRHQKRKVVFAWAQREYRNLKRAWEAGVRVPKPITRLYNLVVMEFIGNEQPAPKLKDYHPGNLRKFLNQVIRNLRNLYLAGLVHADLSEFNILNHKGNPVLIDLSQCTTLQDPNCQEYLDRDVRNLAKFFSQLGLPTAQESIKPKITGRQKL